LASTKNSNHPSTISRLSLQSKVSKKETRRGKGSGVNSFPDIGKFLQSRLSLLPTMRLQQHLCSGLHLWLSEAFFHNALSVKLLRVAPSKQISVVMDSVFGFQQELLQIWQFIACPNGE
jgi:hypothetical protein